MVSKKKKKVLTEIESDFSAEIGNSSVFFAQNQVLSKKKKKKKKKKKRSSPKLGVIFRPSSLGLGWWGGDASLTGAELFEIEADFLAKIVTFRLVGGMHPPIPPPKSATANRLVHWWFDFMPSQIKASLQLDPASQRNKTIWSLGFCDRQEIDSKTSITLFTCRVHFFTCKMYVLVLKQKQCIRLIKIIFILFIYYKTITSK